jgi:hypothetical protein
MELEREGGHFMVAAAEQRGRHGGRIEGAGVHSGSRGGITGKMGG